MKINHGQNKKDSKRVDGQITGLAGELFVAAELLKRNLQVSITFGNAKSIDLFAYNENTNCTHTVQVKALRSKNYFLIRGSAINPEHIYVFVILNEPGKPVDFFIVHGSRLLKKGDLISRFLDDAKMPGISYKDLEPFRNHWHLFEE